MNLNTTSLPWYGRPTKKPSQSQKTNGNPSCIHCHLDILCHMAASSAATLQHLNTSPFVCALLYVVNVPTIDSWRLKK